MTGARQQDEIYLTGGGGHSKVVLSTMRALGLNPAGVIDPRKPILAAVDLPWLGGDEALDRLDPTKVWLVNGLGSVGAIGVRLRVYLRATSLGFRFIKLIHPSAVVASEARLRYGVQVMMGAIVQADVEIGENALINSGVVLEHDCRVGPHSHVASGAILSGGVVLGEAVHVGTGAKIIQGCRIGAGAVIGAGAMVLHDVAEGRTVVGVPARALGSHVRR